MLRDRKIMWVVGIIIMFAIGLIGYYAFSVDKGDGLERTMEEGGAEEGEAIYEAPFDYGSNYPLTFIMGILGFIATFLLIYLIIVLLRKKDAPRDN